MTFPRSSLRRLVPVALTAFLAGAVMPRAAFYTHSHAGGDHVHVHADGAGVHQHTHPHVHPHHEHAWVPASGQPMVEDGDLDGGSHVHWQSPFQRADTDPTPVLVRGEACVVLPRSAPRQPHTDELPPARSRAPPSLLPA